MDSGETLERRDFESDAVLVPKSGARVEGPALPVGQPQLAGHESANPHLGSGNVCDDRDLAARRAGSLVHQLQRAPMVGLGPVG